MTFVERYNQAKFWHEKVLIMNLFHLAMCQRKDVIWNIAKTAQVFNVSVGLVSENLKLASAIDKDKSIMTIDTRTNALKRVK